VALQVDEVALQVDEVALQVDEVALQVDEVMLQVDEEALQVVQNPKSSHLEVRNIKKATEMKISVAFFIRL